MERKIYEGYEIKPKSYYYDIGWIVTNLKTGDWDEFYSIEEAESIIRAGIITGKCYLRYRYQK